MRNILGPVLLACFLAVPAAAQERADAATLFPPDTIAYAEVDAGALAQGLPELQLVRLFSDDRLRGFFQPTLDRLGLDPADVAGSLLKKAQVRDWLAGEAALGLRGFTLTLQDADGKRTLLKISPDRPFDAETATQLLGAWTRYEMGGPMRSEGRFSLDLMAVVEPGPKLKEAVGAFLARPPLPLKQETVLIAGREVQHLVPDREADSAVAWVLMPFLASGVYADLSGDRWILATDKEVMAAAIAGGGRATLANAPSYVNARQRITGGRALAFAYVDAAALVRTVKPCIPPIVYDLCERNGIAALQGVGAGISLSEGGVRESFGVMLDGKLRGAWTLLEALPGGLRSVEVAPPGALAVVGFKFDGTVLRQRVGAILKDLALVAKDEDVSALVRDAMRGAGIDLEKDVLPALGDEIALFVFPPPMGPIPNLVFGMDLRDEAAFRKLLVKAQEAAAAMKGWRFAPLDLGEGIEATQVFATVPMSPCFSVHRGHFFAASSPDLLKRVLLEWGAEGAPSLLEDDEVFPATLKGLNGGSSANLAALGYVNLRTVLPQLYGFLPLMGARLPTEWFDTAQAPDINRISKHFTGAAVGLRVDGDGITLDAFSPAGFLVPSAAWTFVADRRRVAEARARQVVVLRRAEGAPSTGIRVRSSQGEGVRVVAMQEGGPAERAGFQSGDVVVAVNGVDVRTIEDMDREIEKCSPGDTATIKVRRGDGHIEIEVQLGARDD